MARQENVDAVIAAIDTVYRSCGETKPQKSDIIAAAGVSQKTFYRVLNDHPEAKRQLDLAEAVFDRRPGTPDEPEEIDPIKKNPLAAVDELLTTITQLTCVVEAQRIRLGELERQLGTQPVALSSSDR